MVCDLDRWILSADRALRAVSGVAVAGRPVPLDPDLPDAHTELSAEQSRHAAGLMRVDHVGEICAQALYQAQALAARDPQLRAELEQAAAEEADHLAWTGERLRELGSRPSLLNPLWYAGAFAIGYAAGRLGDRVSLGFVVETERQVEEHLTGHMQALPEPDSRSRAIVAQMRDDEVRHGQAAAARGAVELPAPVRLAMRAAAKVMTGAAYWI